MFAETITVARAHAEAVWEHSRLYVAAAASGGLVPP
jgi:hypothetical protein